MGRGSRESRVVDPCDGKTMGQGRTDITTDVEVRDTHYRVLERRNPPRQEEDKDNVYDQG